VARAPIYVSKKPKREIQSASCAPLSLESLAFLRRMEEVYIDGKLVAPNADKMDELVRKQKEIESIRRSHNKET
jgi:hypothetical protein